MSDSTFMDALQETRAAGAALAPAGSAGPSPPRARQAAEGRRAPRPLQLGSLQWTGGIFCTLTGVLMLMLPYQFNLPAYFPIYDDLDAWGAVLLASGLGLILAAVLRPGRGVLLAVHLVAGLPLLSVGLSVWLNSARLLPLATFVLLGLVIALSPLAGWLPRSAAPRDRRGPDLLRLTLGASGVCIGAALLTAADQFAAPLYDPVRGVVPWSGAGLLLGGGAVLVTEAGPGRLRTASPLAAGLLGAALLWHFVAFTLPIRAWLSMPYYGTMGGALLLPLTRLGPAVDTSSLRVRLTLVLVLASLLPLLLAASVHAKQQEASVAAQALSTNETLATALAHDLADYIGLHQAATSALAAHPGLLARPLSEQSELLRAACDVYPALVAIYLFDAEGNPGGRSDGRPPLPLAGLRQQLFDHVRETGRPAVLTGYSDTAGQPAFALASPIRDGGGRFAGLVGAVLLSDRVARQLDRVSASPRSEAYLVDETGHVIAHPDPYLVGQHIDLSSTPPVAALLAGVQHGAVSYAAGGDERVSGFAAVPGLGWGVVVEQSGAAVLGPARSQRELVVLMLVAAAGLALAVGVVVARRLAAPLHALSRAADSLARAEEAAALPATGISEISEVADSFRIMRDRLETRTRERDAVEARLRLLAEAGSAAVTSLEYSSIVDALMRLVVPAFADYCAVYALDAVGALRRSTEMVVPDGPAGAITALPDRYPIHPGRNHPVQQALLAGRAALLSPADILAPLVTGHGPIGVVAFARLPSASRYGPADVDFAGVLAHRFALALNNAQLYRRAQEAIQVREAFMSTAAHELKTPLSVVRAYVQVLGRRLSLPQDSVEELAMAAVVEQCDRLNDLVAGMLDISRLDASGLALQPERFDLAALVSQVVINLQRTTDLHTLSADTAAPALVEADRGRIEQVLSNLIANAVKFSPKGGQILVRLALQDGEAVVAVQDSGIGIPPDRQQHIFTRYYRAHAGTAHDYSGMGIGLHLSQEIILLHGGRIWFTSEEGRGSTFSFALPLVSMPDGAPELSTAQSAPHRGNQRIQLEGLG